MKETWNLVAKALVIIGSLNWLSIGAFNTNLVQISFLHSIEHLVYVIVGISALFLMFRRDFYLPFLGTTVFPHGVISKESTPKDATESVTVFVNPGTKVVYWAAETSKEPKWDSPKQAYGDYENAGVVVANALGHAILRVRSPSGYTVPWMRKTVTPHVHYRVEIGRGMWGPVKTVGIR